MKVILDINNETVHPISKKFMEEVIRETLKRCFLKRLKEKSAEISLAFLNPEKIREINSKYRKKDKNTDILSFPNYRSKKELQKDKNRKIFLGELLVDYEFVKKSAKVNNGGLEAELAFVISHGVLHLLGLKHGREMFKLQDELANKFINKKNGQI